MPQGRLLTDTPHRQERRRGRQIHTIHKLPDIAFDKLLLDPPRFRVRSARSGQRAGGGVLVERLIGFCQGCQKVRDRENGIFRHVQRAPMMARMISAQKHAMATADATKWAAMKS